MGKILYFIVKKGYSPRYLHNIKDICKTYTIAKEVLNKLNNKDDFEILKINYTGGDSQWVRVLCNCKDEHSKHLCFKMIAEKIADHYSEKIIKDMEEKIKKEKYYEENNNMYNVIDI